MTIVLNRRPGPTPIDRAPTSGALSFHRTLPGYAPTPLVELGEVAAEHGWSRVAIKNEQRRFGLPAYKVLGGSWALHEAIRRQLGKAEGVVIPFAELREAARGLGPVTLTTATDGNHGRGIAFMAQHLGFECVIFIPRDMVAEREAAIASHGARVVRVGGGYEEAVQQAMALAKESGAWLCADTAGEDTSAPDHRFAHVVQAGYHTLFAEMIEQAGRAPDLLVVQAGVGALTASAIEFFAINGHGTSVVTAEPVGSACVQASITAGEPTAVEDSFSVMAGLRSEHISLAAWPLMQGGVRAAVSVDDAEAIAAIRLLSRYGVEAGESGAAGLAGLLQLSQDATTRQALGLSRDSVAMVINTEGATDREAYARYLG